ncbi:MAG: hypothetical protein R2799_13030 [Crocinitomicaceae bacterium]
MREHEDYLVKIRPQIQTIEEIPVSKEDEIFQNSCLRPIIKYQHDLIIEVFQKEKNLLTLLKRNNNSKEQTYLVILQYVKTNKALSFLIFGLIYGLMTSKESQYYLENHKELNKRITSMVSERLNNQFWESL